MRLRAAGFTLIELLLVVALLAGLLVGAMNVSAGEIRRAELDKAAIGLQTDLTQVRGYAARQGQSGRLRATSATTYELRMGTQRLSRTLPAGVTLSPTNFDVTYQAPDATVLTGSSTLLDLNRGSDGRTLRLVGYTGKVVRE